MTYKRPYHDYILSDALKIRTFDPLSGIEKFIWHKDKSDRKVLIIDGNGWKFQFDDELPFCINKNDIITIPKKTYHRLIPGTSTLVIAIEE